MRMAEQLRQNAIDALEAAEEKVELILDIDVRDRVCAELAQLITKVRESKEE